MSVKHARLSASASHRWLKCTASVKFIEELKRNKKIKEKTNKAAEEGTLLHEFTEIALREGMSSLISNSNFMNQSFENRTAVEDCYKFVSDNFIKTGTLFGIEERVDFSKYVENAFGTVDFFSCNTKGTKKQIDIVDFKFGRNPVKAEENPQMLLYALGILQQFEVDVFKVVDFLKKSTFNLHILQPKINNFDSWQIPTGNNNQYLKDFAEFVAEKSREALSDNSKFVPGAKQCRYCDAQVFCKERYEDFKNNTIEIFRSQEKSPTFNSKMITTAQRISILKKAKEIRTFLDELEKDTIDQLQDGANFPGVELKEGRRVREITEEGEKVLFKILGEKAYEKKLIGIKKAESILGKSELDKLCQFKVGSMKLKVKS